MKKCILAITAALISVGSSAWAANNGKPPPSAAGRVRGPLGSECDAVPGNLVTNCGFETGDFSGWDLSGDLSYTGVDDASSHSGNFGAFLGPVYDLGFMAQRLPTNPGDTYGLTFWLANAEQPNHFQVFWDGELIFDGVDLPDFPYTQYEFDDLIATSASTELKFGFYNLPSYLFLDDVVAKAPAVCGRAETDKRIRVVTACAKGRASATELPGGAGHIFNSSTNEAGTRYDNASNWNYGFGPGGPPPMGHPAFGLTPAGDAFNAATHIMPPYLYGARSQKCDDKRYKVMPDMAGFNACNTAITADLADPAKNYRGSAATGNQWYYRKTGHNCHHAASDFGMCLVNANPRITAGCGFDPVKVVVFDAWAVPEANRIGNQYHSMVLVTSDRGAAGGGRKICLVESQRRRKDGHYAAACCVPYDAKWLGRPDGMDYNTWVRQWKATFRGCPDLDDKFKGNSIAPTIYPLNTFLANRDSGPRDDMQNSYDLNAGRDALPAGPGAFALGPGPDLLPNLCSAEGGDCILAGDLGPGPDGGDDEFVARTFNVTCTDDDDPTYETDDP